MTRSLAFLLAAAPMILAGCQNKNVPDTLPTSYAGTLHGGMMAIGGETSGWVLVGDAESGGIQLDVSRVRDTANRLDGQRVIASGRMIQRDYVERGPVNVLVVDSIVPASENSR